MSPPLVSVVVPNYNYGRFLSEALESVFRQTYSELEVVVVDDGSTDDSEEVLSSCGERIRWFRQQNSGVSRARNRGILESRGELIAFLDADDVWLPDKLSKQVALMERHGYGMVYTGLQYVSPAGTTLGESCKGLSGRVLEAMTLLERPGILGTGSTALVRRECFERVGVFAPELSTSADWDMCRRIACRYEIGMVPEALVRYRLHSSSMHKNVELFERDMLLAFDRLFADAAAREVHPLRRRAWAKLFLTLSGSFYRSGRFGKSISYAVKSLLLSPGGLLHITSMSLRRRAEKRSDELACAERRMEK